MSTSIPAMEFVAIAINGSNLSSVLEVIMQTSERKLKSCRINARKANVASVKLAHLRRRPVSERFWEKVAKSNECWLWTASLDRYGYGKFGNSVAHRIVWELIHGPIEKGKLICHHCDVRHCVRADHLFLGTPQDNSKDASNKGRLRFGERNHKAVLTEKDVKRIRASQLSQTELAKMFGVSQATISAIRLRQIWKRTL